MLYVQKDQQSVKVAGAGAARAHETHALKALERLVSLRPRTQQRGWGSGWEFNSWLHLFFHTRSRTYPPWLPKHRLFSSGKLIGLPSFWDIELLDLGLGNLSMLGKKTKLGRKYIRVKKLLLLFRWKIIDVVARKTERHTYIKNTYIFHFVHNNNNNNTTPIIYVNPKKMLSIVFLKTWRKIVPLFIFHFSFVILVPFA